MGSLLVAAQPAAFSPKSRWAGVFFQRLLFVFFLKWMSEDLSGSNVRTGGRLFTSLQVVLGPSGDLRLFKSLTCWEGCDVPFPAYMVRVGRGGGGK